MKQEQIIEGNKLIAEFMEYPDLGTKGDFSYLKYHASWDWIMPVVEKIEDIQDGEEGDTVRVHFYDVEIRQSVCTINGTEIEVIADRKIDAVYQAVVEFINWYNKQN